MPIPNLSYLDVQPAPGTHPHMFETDFASLGWIPDHALDIVEGPAEDDDVSDERDDDLDELWRLTRMYDARRAAAAAPAPVQGEPPAPAADLLPVDPVAAETAAWHTDDAIRYDFGIDLQLVESFLMATGLKLPKPSKRSTRREEVLRAYGAIIASAVMAADGGRRCSYSRRREHFSLRREYDGKSYTYTNVVGGIEKLVDKGYLDHHVAKGGREREVGVQSTFWALPALLEAFDGVELKRPSELRMPLRLRDERGNLMPYKSSDVTRALLQDLTAINGWLRCLKVTLPGVRRSARGQWLFEKVVIENGKKKVVRSVVCPTEFPQVYQMGSRGDATFELHGRYYGYWQNVPADWRSGLMINGMRCVEIDFSALHPTLLYAQRGIDITAEGFDPYAVPGYEGDEMRVCCKLALNVAINAKSRAEAVNALMARRKAVDPKKRWWMSRKATEALLDACITHNNRIAEAICSDAGIRLMRVDSRIMREILVACMASSISCLPVHDSVVVPARYQDQVKAIMERAYCQVTGISTPCKVKVEAKAVPSQIPCKKIPQMGSGRALAPGSSRLCPSSPSPIPGAAALVPASAASAMAKGDASVAASKPVSVAPQNSVSSLKPQFQSYSGFSTPAVPLPTRSPKPLSLADLGIAVIEHEPTEADTFRISDADWDALMRTDDEIPALPAPVSPAPVQRKRRNARKTWLKFLASQGYERNVEAIRRSQQQGMVDPIWQ